MNRFIIIFAFVLLTIFFFFKIGIEKKSKDGYLEKLNLKLVGILLDDPDCPNGYNGFCILNVQILSSNIKDYDPRGNEDKYYYCVIQNNRAQIYQQGLRDCVKGDSIMVDTEKKIFICKRTGLVFPILLNSDNRFYKYIANHHQQI